METRININYTESNNVNIFGTFSLSFQGYDGQLRTVKLKFDPKSLWEFSQETSSVAFDFLILSLIVYNVDRAINRLQYSVDGWRRDLKLVNVPVSNLRAMDQGRNAIIRAINFLTGDNWDINFTQAQPYHYLPTRNIQRYEINEYEKVMLFSGGMDSLIGFIDEASTLQNEKKILLISHMELGKERSDQKSILNYCQENHIFTNKYRQLLLNAGLKPNSWNIPKTSGESTFRARSLLFFASGIYAAHHISSSTTLIVPENGTISFKCPWSYTGNWRCQCRSISRWNESSHGRRL